MGTLTGMGKAGQGREWRKKCTEANKPKEMNNKRNQNNQKGSRIVKEDQVFCEHSSVNLGEGCELLFNR